MTIPKPYCPGCIVGWLHTFKQGTHPCVGTHPVHMGACKTVPSPAQACACMIVHVRSMRVSVCTCNPCRYATPGAAGATFSSLHPTLHVDPPIACLHTHMHLLSAGAPTASRLSPPPTCTTRRAAGSRAMVVLGPGDVVAHALVGPHSALNVTPMSDGVPAASDEGVVMLGGRVVRWAWPRCQHRLRGRAERSR